MRSDLLNLIYNKARGSQREAASYRLLKWPLSLARDPAAIIDRLDDVKRLIQMENTLLTASGIYHYRRFRLTSQDGQQIGDDLIHSLRDEIQLQLLSIVALCYGDNPDLGEPSPMLEWVDTVDSQNAQDVFREVWKKCLIWNA